ncbi:uncharacterized protein PHALS_13422 [Plasmopara halstedii]|uniref:Uncharacterized protein n=1 Tax=Plasmopara halstedii TaxID=4781 RepID=A0A0P1APG7_PLAHL|nr:uncharacterized protein PHALS_13422 [Plasmopara halstedii]CEG43209.1 hypothetical protein PHALS_13422 [Plasmopara halstedii]|eukprot:XP_024579578.1 hypothetical protein PHALS_13422 [Plasmopara halstedii]
MAFVQGLDPKVHESKDYDIKKETQAISDAVDEDIFHSDSDDQYDALKRTPTLLDVAKHEDFIATRLSFAINDIENEYKSTKATHKAHCLIEPTHLDVNTERAGQRNKQGAAGFIEQQQQYEDDEFEVDAANVRKAAEILATKAAKASSVGHHLPSRNRSKPSKGAISSSPLTKVEMQRAMMQYKLSNFQSQQLPLTQRRLFLASIAQGNSLSNAKNKKRVANREAINELAKDKLTQARQQQKDLFEFARFDDERHCRFHPRLHNYSSKKASQSSPDDEGGRVGDKVDFHRLNDNFIRRMEAGERARQEQLRRTREEAAYSCRLDKKECHTCGNTQSYSELTQKRKKCPNCGVTYRSRIVWSDVAKEFLSRMEEFQKQYKERHREKQEEYERQEELACTPKQDVESSKKTWDEVRDEFLGRLQLDMEYREMSRAAIMEEIQRECSFSPSITRRAQMLKLDEFDERMRRDLIGRRNRLKFSGSDLQKHFCLGFESDLNYCCNHRPSKFAQLSKRSKIEKWLCRNLLIALRKS